jgi:hypothetical protein
MEWRPTSWWRKHLWSVQSVDKDVVTTETEDVLVTAAAQIDYGDNTIRHRMSCKR